MSSSATNWCNELASSVCNAVSTHPRNVDSLFLAEIRTNWLSCSLRNIHKKRLKRHG
jgi:hypothetical protein